jgi:DNA-binding transcriptional regulator YhcF (GntR family)
MPVQKVSLSSAPLKRERLHDQIVRFLAIEILRGNLRQGHPAVSSEVELCRRLKVSRTVLRESNKVLAANGLVDVRPKVGIRIRPREDWNLVDPDLLAWQHESWRGRFPRSQSRRSAPGGGNGCRRACGKASYRGILSQDQRLLPENGSHAN